MKEKLISRNASGLWKIMNDWKAMKRNFCTSPQIVKDQC